MSFCLSGGGPTGGGEKTLVLTPRLRLTFARLESADIVVRTTYGHRCVSEQKLQGFGMAQMSCGSFHHHHCYTVLLVYTHAAHVRSCIMRLQRRK